MRKFDGAPPAVGVVLAENNEWSLYERANSFDAWVGLKLVSKQPRQYKANFWLAWSPAQQRLALNKDERTLSKHFPELYQWVWSAMQKARPVEAHSDLA